MAGFAEQRQVLFIMHANTTVRISRLVMDVQRR
jgi:hypothetical protein